MESMPGIGWGNSLGTIMRGVAAVPEATVGIMELSQSLMDPGGFTGDVLAGLARLGGLDKFSDAFKELGEAGGGTFWRTLSKADELKGELKGEWMRRGGDEEDATWEKAQRKIDKLISGITSTQQAFTETHTMAGMTSLAAGHAYTKPEYMTHFNRFAEYHDFSYQLRRRNQRQMRYEMGLHSFQSFLTSFEDVADFTTGWYGRAYP